MTEPLVTNGELVRCGTRHGCPAGHYCHHTHLFSVCCEVTTPQSVSSSPTVSVTPIITASSVFGEFSTITSSPTVRTSVTATATPIPEMSGSGQYSDLSGSGQYSDFGGTGQLPHFTGSGEFSVAAAWRYLVDVKISKPSSKSAIEWLNLR